MAKEQYSEFRADGWPMCPQCEEDELYSVLMLCYHGDGAKPTLEECLAAEMRCYQCNWSSVKTGIQEEHKKVWSLLLRAIDSPTATFRNPDGSYEHTYEAIDLNAEFPAFVDVPVNEETE